MKKRVLIPLMLVACKAPAEPESAPVKASPAQAAPARARPLDAGDPAPSVTLQLHDGEAYALDAHADSLVFVYFYPKDDTPGCTVEAKGLRDRYAELSALGVEVIGVSLQDAASHRAFIEAYALPFPLAVDDGTAARAFGVPVHGEFAARQSFLLHKGKVVKAWRRVSPAGHAAEVLAAAKAAT